MLWEAAASAAAACEYELALRGGYLRAFEDAVAPAVARDGLA